MEVLNGILFHTIGASSAALCYTPQKKVAKWSWQTYWLAQAFVCWLLLPVVVAYLTIPDIFNVLKEAPAGVLLKTFALGAAYGIGGTAFGIAIRYVGFSLTYAISVGISCVLGTLLPPLVRGELETIMWKPGAGWLMAGIAFGAIGIFFCGMAGRYKEIDMQLKGTTTSSFSLSKGLPLCFLSGVLSAVYGFAIDQGQPLAAIAAEHGAGDFQGNVIYIFSNSGAFLTSAIYCIYLHVKQRTFKEYGAGFFKQDNTALKINYAMALVTGVLWYGQFFFYGLGHVRMGNYKFSSWAIHMVMLVLLSTVAGLMLKEWKPVKRRTIQTLGFAVIILIVAVLLLTYGNYVGSIA